MNKYILFALTGLICLMPLFADYKVKNGNAWGKIGSGIGEGFRRGLEDSIRQQQQLELLERERQIQLEILERQKQIQMELLERQRYAK